VRFVSSVLKLAQKIPPVDKEVDKATNPALESRRFIPS
jgi:hypothetical protein